MQRAVHVGGRLSAGLKALAADGVVDHARGEGAMWAAGLKPGMDAMKMRDHMMNEGGVVCRALNADSLLFCPPLVITDEQIDRIVDAVSQAAVATA